MEFVASILAKRMRNTAKQELRDIGGLEANGKLAPLPKVKGGDNKGSDEDDFAMLREAAGKAHGKRKEAYEKALKHKRKS